MRFGLLSYRSNIQSAIQQETKIQQYTIPVLTWEFQNPIIHPFNFQTTETNPITRQEV